MIVRNRIARAVHIDVSNRAARQLALLCAGAVASLFLIGCSGESALQPDSFSAIPELHVEGLSSPMGLESAVPVDAEIKPQDRAGFPAFPVAGSDLAGTVPPRQQSFVDTLSLNADEYYGKSGGAAVDGSNNLVLPVPAGGYDWGIYCFDGFVRGDEVFGITVNLADPYPTEYYLGIADFDTERWRWYRIIAPFSSHTFGMPWYINPVSPDGKTYVAMVATKMQVSIVSAVLDSNLTAPAPVGIVATDGARPDRIDLSWEDMAVSYPNTNYDAIVVERAFSPEGPWDQIGEVGEGNNEYSDLNDTVSNPIPYNTEVYYNLRTRFGVEVGPRGQADTGSRLLADVAGLSATDGEWADKIRINWEPIAGARSYELEYMADDAGDEPADWTPLFIVPGELANLFDHTLNFPDTQPSNINTTYRYRVRAAYNADRSIQWSAAETGYRALSPIRNFSASKGTAPDEVLIAWDEVAGASGYILQYINDDGGAPSQWTQLAQLTSNQTTFEHTFNSPVGKECEYSTTYNYRVKPLLGVESASVWGQADLGFRQVEDVSGFSATTDEFQDQVLLSWDQVDLCDGYEIQYVNDDGGAPTNWSLLEYVNSGNTEFSHSSTTLPTGRECQANTTYRYRVKAGFINDRSLIWAYSSGRRYLDTPASLSASEEWFADKVSLSWDAVEGATGYAVYRDQLATTLATTGAAENYYDDIPADFDEHNYWVTALDAASESDFSDVSVGERIEWIIQVVHSGDDVGQYAALASIGGNPAIAYQNVDDNSMYYAAAGTGLPVNSGDWDEHVLALPLGGGPTGVDNDLVELPNGNPAVCFRDNSEFYLYFGSASTPTPTTTGDWAIHAVDNTGYTGLFNSMAIIDGKPAIAFYNGSLQYAQAAVSLPTQTSDWAIHEVDATGDCGWYTSLIEISGVPAISYYEHTPGYDLRFALAGTSNPVAGGDWAKHSVASTGDVGRYSSLAMDAGKPVISYMNQTYGDLVVAAAATTPSSESDWQETAVDTAGVTGMYSSIVLMGGLPVVCCYNETDGVLRLSKAVAAIPAGFDWVSHTVDSTADVGMFADLKLIAGQLAIAYYDADNQQLKFARTN